LTATPVKDAIFETERQRDLKRKKKEEAKENKKQKITKRKQDKKRDQAKVALDFSDSSDAASVELCADTDDSLHLSDMEETVKEPTEIKPLGTSVRKVQSIMLVKSWRLNWKGTV